MKFKIEIDMHHHHHFEVEIDAEDKKEAWRKFCFGDALGQYAQEWEKAEDEPVEKSEYTTITEVQA